MIHNESISIICVLPNQSPYPEGDWKCYLMQNSDLIGALNWTNKDADFHYIHQGRAEIRKTSCRKDEPRVNISDESTGKKIIHKDYCCYLQLFYNIGHALTENTIDLYRCGPVVSFVDPPMEIT